MVLNTRWRRPDSQTVRVALMVVCLAVLTVALGYRHLGERPHSDVGVSLPWWFFVAAFALTEAVVMNIQVRREAQTISTSELPLVLGLFLAAPGALLLGRLVGSCLIFVFYRRSSALKSTFNAALVSAETVVAISVFHLVLPGMSALGPRSWLAAYAARAC